jgi:hypothetical protein
MGAYGGVRAEVAWNPLQNFVVETKRLQGGRGNSKTHGIC